MGSTYASLTVHIVFGTKHQLPIIDSTWAPDLHAYFGGILCRLGATPLEINGVADHVHILAGIRPTQCISDLLREIKAGTSKWVHDRLELPSFWWQDGFGAFSVGPRGVERAREYIRNQQAHHSVTTFRDEFIALLRHHGIAFDERYLL